MVGKYNIVLGRGGTITCWNDGINRGAFGRSAEIIAYHTSKFVGHKAGISQFFI